MADPAHAYHRDRAHLAGENLLSLPRDVLVFVVALGAWWLFLDADTVRENVNAGFLALAATIAVELVRWLYRFVWTAPVQIHRDQVATIDRLERERDEARAARQSADERQAIAEALQERHDWAVHNLLNGRWDTSLYEVPLKAAYGDWCDSVIAVLKRANATAPTISHFQVLGQFSHVVFANVHTHCQHTMNLVSARLGRLKELIARYQQEL